MIPTEDQILRMWDAYNLPDNKRLHVRLVAKVSMAFVDCIVFLHKASKIDKPLLYASALLHDIDKNVTFLPGEQHPDACVRILKKENMHEVAAMVETHALHKILSAATAPKSLEEKILFLSDKMVKYTIISVDKRFELWRKEKMSNDMRRILDESYPKVKKLENEILTLCNMQDDGIASAVKQV